MKNQAESKSHVAPSTDPLELKGCLNVPFGVILSGSFNKNVVITFSALLLESLVVPNLDFMDQTTTPQSIFSTPGDASNPAGPS